MHLGRSSELKTLNHAEKVKWGPTDQPTDGLSKRGVESRSTRLKKVIKSYLVSILHLAIIARILANFPSLTLLS